jgi:hypothetical protein
VPHFYVKFCNDDLENFTHGFFHDAVGNAFKASVEFGAEDLNAA